MEKIYKIRECRQDILRGKLQAEMLLEQLQRWNKEDFEKHSPTYVTKMSHELMKLAEDIRDIQNSQEILNMTLLTIAAMDDYVKKQEENK